MSSVRKAVGWKALALLATLLCVSLSEAAQKKAKDAKGSRWRYDFTSHWCNRHAKGLEGDLPCLHCSFCRQPPPPAAAPGANLFRRVGTNDQPHAACGSCRLPPRLMPPLLLLQCCRSHLLQGHHADIQPACLHLTQHQSAAPMTLPLSLNTHSHTCKFPQTEDGKDPLVWDDDELSRIRELHAKSFTDKSEYLRSKNLAEYLGLAPVDQMHMPLPLHIVFIGFKVRAQGAVGCLIIETSSGVLRAAVFLQAVSMKQQLGGRAWRVWRHGSKLWGCAWQGREQKGQRACRGGRCAVMGAAAGERSDAQPCRVFGALAALLPTIIPAASHVSAFCVCIKTEHRQRTS